MEESKIQEISNTITKRSSSSDYQKSDTKPISSTDKTVEPEKDSTSNPYLVMEGPSIKLHQYLTNAWKIKSLINRQLPILKLYLRHLMPVRTG